jgi:two-component system phosphate regulon sensor histidine kinase PhoR
MEDAMAIWWIISIVSLAALAGWLIGRYVNEVRSVVGLANAVAAEPEVPPAAVRTGGELGRLQTAVMHMAEVLQQRLADVQAEEQRLEAVLGGMVEGVLVVDPDSIVVLSNRRAQELLELPPDEDCVGRPLIELTRHPDIHELIRRAKQETDARRSLAEEMVLDETRHQTLQVTATPLIGEDDREARAFILVFHDVSELKHLERIRRDFVANVSHELRTPLSAIRGYSETLLTGALDDPEAARRFLGIIERHAERLGRLVDDLLTLSDLELGRTDLKRQAVEAGELIDRVIEVLNDRSVRAGIDLAQEVAPGTPSLDADPDRVEQALLNLVDNAIKYTPEGGRVRVSARAAAVSGANGQPMVELRVADTGIGVPSEDLPRLTERFYRVDKARSRQLGGTGLGLAIVKHIAQAHGGWLHIDSELHRGTTVSLYLPSRAEILRRAS